MEGANAKGRPRHNLKKGQQQRGGGLGKALAIAREKELKAVRLKFKALNNTNSDDKETLQRLKKLKEAIPALSINSLMEGVRSGVKETDPVKSAALKAVIARAKAHQSEKAAPSSASSDKSLQNKKSNYNPRDRDSSPRKPFVKENIKTNKSLFVMSLGDELPPGAHEGGRNHEGERKDWRKGKEDKKAPEPNWKRQATPKGSDGQGDRPKPLQKEAPIKVDPIPNFEAPRLKTGWGVIPWKKETLLKAAGIEVPEPPAASKPLPKVSVPNEVENVSKEIEKVSEPAGPRELEDWESHPSWVAKRMLQARITKGVREFSKLEREHKYFDDEGNEISENEFEAELAVENFDLNDEDLNIQPEESDEMDLGSDSDSDDMELEAPSKKKKKEAPIKYSISFVEPPAPKPLALKLVPSQSRDPQPSDGDSFFLNLPPQPVAPSAKSSKPNRPAPSPIPIKQYSKEELRKQIQSNLSKLKQKPSPKPKSAPLSSGDPDSPSEGDLFTSLGSQNNAQEEEEVSSSEGSSSADLDSMFASFKSALKKRKRDS